MYLVFAPEHCRRKNTKVRDKYEILHVSYSGGGCERRIHTSDSDWLVGWLDLSKYRTCSILNKNSIHTSELLFSGVNERVIIF